ncbi:LytTR family transcriptional regulator [Spirosoma taeanense]|uniref:LytTR family transcriptional regulator n=1 Tax=Spirosoma taeanense TaxID=2735870 RepID=A0A6M5Y757_9BACT|nr:LytTR family DNA-binding domain-containing protein [Spirosoma taeanense]QJW90218.1 LytTR family transcriptional regulator [Spirosoma taeanense]
MVQGVSAVFGRTTPLLHWPPIKVYTRDTGRQSFQVMDLLYAQAEANYSWLNWADGQRMLLPRPLNYYVAKLPPECFIRLHRNCLVNRYYVHHLERTDQGGLVYLTTGEALPVSRRRWGAIYHQLQCF